MRLRSRLLELMQERSMTVDTLRKRSGVGAETIAALRNNSGQQVSYRALGAVCAVLNVTLDQLFELIPEEIWAPIRTSREVTIHHGSRTVVEPPQAKHSRGKRGQVRQYIGVWDQRAINLITEHLHRSGSDVHVRQEEHITGEGRGFEPEARDSARRVFRQGNHVLIGSPIANQFAEEVVCHAYQVPPHSPSMRHRFPYGFVWEARVASSFGWTSESHKLGIASTRTGALVASRTTVLSGEGRDCALVLVHRLWSSSERGAGPGEDERVIIAILGHTGVGTYAATQLALDPGWSAGLYPREPGRPLMRVVTATYASSPVTPPRDTRQVTSWTLLDDASDAPPASVPVPAGDDQKRMSRGESAKVT